MTTRRNITMRARMAALIAAAALLAASLTAAAAPASASTACTPGVTTREYVTPAGSTTNYYLAAPDNVTSGSSPEQKTTPNATTAFTHCDAASGPAAIAFLYSAGGKTYALRNNNLDGTHVYFEQVTPGSVAGSEMWDWVTQSNGTLTFRNRWSGRYLRIPNSGPAPYAPVVAGASQTAWTQGAPLARTTALREPAASAACSDLSSQGVTCGSQELATLPLMLAARNKALPGSNLEVKAASSSNNTEDWESLPAPDPPLTGSGALVYSPGGRQSDLCLARSGGWVVLADCDPASWSQQIITIENPGKLPGYRMEFRGTSLVIAGPNRYRPYRVLVAIPADGKPGQNWSFQG